MRKLRGTMPPSNLFIFKEKYIYGKVTRGRFINPFRPWDPICCCNSYCKAGNSVWCGVVINWHRFDRFNLTIGIKKKKRSGTFEETESQQSETNSIHRFLFVPPFMAITIFAKSIMQREQRVPYQSIVRAHASSTDKKTKDAHGTRA